jgi:hypothetical protein
MQLPYKYYDTWGRGAKMSFAENDQYLLGGKSCGAYLFMSPTGVKSLIVDGDNKFGRKTIGNVDSKQVNSTSKKSPKLAVEVVFQYRMTDYFGVTTSSVDTSTGAIGGRKDNPISNLTYSKTIGIDIFDANDNQFSFDLQIFAKYKPKGYNLKNVKTVQLTKTLI